jgi:hypothetical protein
MKIKQATMLTFLNSIKQDAWDDKNNNTLLDMMQPLSFMIYESLFFRMPFSLNKTRSIGSFYILACDPGN